MGMEKIGIEEARKTLGDLVEKVRLTGARFILMRYGKPAALLNPLDAAREAHRASEHDRIAGKLRQFGLTEDQIAESMAEAEWNTITDVEWDTITVQESGTVTDRTH